jgi:hypothetical protein
MAKKKETMGQRVIALEGRETIMYEFIDELRAISRKFDKRIEENEIQHQARMRESDERVRMNEEGVNETRALIRAVNTLHSDSQKRIAQNEKQLLKQDERISQNEVEITLMRKLQETMNERLIRLEDRKNGSHKK